MSVGGCRQSTENRQPTTTTEGLHPSVLLVRLPFRAVGVDVLFFDRVQVGVERCIVISSIVADLILEITRLITRGAAGLTLAILLRERAFVCPDWHRGPPRCGSACKNCLTTRPLRTSAADDVDYTERRDDRNETGCLYLMTV